MQLANMNGEEWEMVDGKNGNEQQWNSYNNFGPCVFLQLFIFTFSKRMGRVKLLKKQTKIFSILVKSARGRKSCANGKWEIF